METEKIKIGVIEDEMVIADTIALELRRLKYDVAFIAGNYNSALAKLEACKPDLVLVDIMLSSKKDGIDLAHIIREKYPIPIIFLTANSDIKTVERAKEVKPNAYLVKPFSQSDLYAAIEIAMSNHKALENPKAESILVKDGYNYEKVFLNTIMFASSDHNYVTLHLNTGKRVMVRCTIQEMENKLNPHLFLRINRGNIINASFVDTIETEKVFVGETEFKVQKTQRDVLVSLIEKLN
jgi:DNA-binding LytR/AlgR family response regulator